MAKQWSTPAIVQDNFSTNGVEGEYVSSSAITQLAPDSKAHVMIERIESPGELAPLSIVVETSNGYGSPQIWDGPFSGTGHRRVPEDVLDNPFSVYIADVAEYRIAITNPFSTDILTVRITESHMEDVP